MSDHPIKPKDETPVAVRMPRWLWGRVSINLLQSINLLDDMLKNPQFELLRPTHTEMYDEAWAAYNFINAALKEHDDGHD